MLIVSSSSGSSGGGGAVRTAAGRGWNPAYGMMAPAGCMRGG